MINTASNFLALLQNDSIKLKTASINKIEVIIDECWAEVSDHIKTLEDLQNAQLDGVSIKDKLLLSFIKCELLLYSNRKFDQIFSSLIP